MVAPAILKLGLPQHIHTSEVPFGALPCVVEDRFLVACSVPRIRSQRLGESRRDSIHSPRARHSMGRSARPRPVQESDIRPNVCVRHESVS